MGRGLWLTPVITALERPKQEETHCTLEASLFCVARATGQDHVCLFEESGDVEFGREHSRGGKET